MKIDGALSLDLLPLDAKNGDWARALNIMIDKGFRSPVNEQGFDLTHSLEFNVIGTISTANEAIVFSQGEGGVVEGSVGSISFSKIESCDRSGTRTTILRTQYLSFDKGRPIRGCYKYDRFGELLVAWCDGTDDDSNPLGMIKINDLPFLGGLDSEYELAVASEVTAAYMFPEVSIPNIQVVNEYQGGGGIAAGAHYIALAYKLPYDDYSNYIGISKPVMGFIQAEEPAYDNPVAPAATTQIQSTFTQSVDNAKDGERTGKTVELQITNLDVKFTHYKLAVIHKINSSFTVDEFYDFPINSATENFVYSGQLGDETKTLNDITIDNYIFDKAQDVIAVNNQLVAGGIREKDEIKYQKYANNIKVTYGLTSPSVLNTPLTLNLFKSVTPDEVYALYIRLVRKNGKRESWIHIPGRDMDTFDADDTRGGGGGGVSVNEDVCVIDPATGIDDPNIANSGASAWKFSVEEEKINATTLKYFQIRDTSGTHSANGVAGTMGFWYNEDEYYDQTSEETEVWDVTSGVGHRITGTRNGVAAYKKLQDKQAQTAIGGDAGDPVNVMHHKTPSGIFTGFTTQMILKLNFADIKFPDEIIEEIQGFEIGYAQRDASNISVIGQSFLITTDWSDTVGARTLDHIRFYDFGMLTDTSSKDVSYIKSHRQFTPTYAAIGGTGGQYNFGTGLTTAAYHPLTTPAGPPLGVGFANAVVDCNRSNRFLADNSATPDYSNSDREECWDLKVSGSGLLTDKLTVNPATGAKFNVGIAVNYLKNVYYRYYNQKVASTGLFTVVRAGVNTYTVSNLYGADTIYIEHVVPVYSGSAADGLVAGGSYFFKYQSYCLYHGALRRKPDTKYWADYSKVDLPYSTSLDYSSILNLKDITPYNPNVNYITNFQYRLLKGWNATTEDTATNWRQFDANAYYEMPNTKGKIYNLESIDKGILVEMLYTRYSMGIKNRLQTDNITAYLDDGELFDNSPDEVLRDDKGYTGSQSLFGSVVTPYGIITVDRKLGKVFLYNGQMVDLTTPLVEGWLRDNLDTNSTYPDMDNPYIGNGICVIFDEDNDRILITKKNYLTVSYVYQTSVTLGGSSYTYDTIESFNPGGSPGYQGVHDPTGAVEDYAVGDVFKYGDNYYLVYGVTYPYYGMATSLLAADYNFLVASGDGCAALLLIPEDTTSDNASYYTYSDEVSWTLSYHLKKKQWVCFHTYTPEYYYDTQFGLFAGNNRNFLSTVDSQIYKMNSPTLKGRYFRTDGGDVVTSPSYIDLIINQNPEDTKEWEAIGWQTTTVDTNGVKLYDETINKILVYTDNQCTGYLTVDLKLKDWFDKTQGRERNESYWLNQILDAVLDNKIAMFDSFYEPTANVDATKLDWFDKSRLIGKYIVIRLWYGNADLLGVQRKITFNNIAILAIMPDIK